MDKLDALPFEEITIPQFWDYDEDWCNKNIKAKFDLDRICRHANASFEICYFIYGYGLEIHTNVRWLNKKIESVKNGKLYSLNLAEINSFLSNLCRPSSGYWWSNLSDLQLQLEMVNYELAPKKVLDIVNIALSLIEQGTKTHKLVEKYVKEIQEVKHIEEREQSEAKHNELRRLSRQEKIELKHVELKEGFIYILSHPMMPGIYKIGFTGRNPDVRAAELSTQIGLPISFNVIKYWRTSDPYIVEQRVFKEISDYLTAGEYFEGDQKLFCEVIEKHINVPDNLDSPTLRQNMRLL